MAWIRTIQEDEATGELADFYREAAEQGRRVSNVERVVSLNPRAMKAMAAFRRSWRDEGVLSDRHREMVAVVTSALNRCLY